ncbi:hypothetical protein DAI22_11g121550 [Oryza sativa Japonica Group]|nr:hypothetical protein DAI22_11g121550 [Oryza sativa Japonica Group]
MLDYSGRGGEEAVVGLGRWRRETVDGEGGDSPAPLSHSPRRHVIHRATAAAATLGDSRAVTPRGDVAAPRRLGVLHHNQDEQASHFCPPKHSHGTRVTATTLAQTARRRLVTAASSQTASCKPMQSGARRALWQLLLRPCTNRA